MHALMKTHDRSTEKILLDRGIPGTVPDFKKQEWLFTTIAGLPPEADGHDVPEDVFKKMEYVTRQLINIKKPIIGEFRKIVYKSSKNKNFSNHRTRIKGLITNLLELLYRLKQHHAAIRDLKPDNMYIAAFLDGADHILADPDAFEMGLIDLETALCFKPRKNGRIEQPLLAGTPSYATPSHIFGNKVLRNIYTDELPRIFQLQDMQAVMVMIFKVITGRIMFVKTARLMPEISHLKKKNAQDFQSLSRCSRASARPSGKRR
jgi:serine/threonine protein kinase